MEVLEAAEPRVVALVEVSVEGSVEGSVVVIAAAEAADEVSIHCDNNHGQVPFGPTVVV